LAYPGNQITRYKPRNLFQKTDHANQPGSCKNISEKNPFATDFGSLAVHICVTKKNGLQLMKMTLKIRPTKNHGAKRDDDIEKQLFNDN
jgi:hypothetical protein